MTAPTIDRVEEILRGQPTAETLAWLRNGFERHLAGESLAGALGIHAAFPRGLRDGVLRARWRAKLSEAIDLLNTDSVSAWSIALILEAEFARQARSHRPPRSELERIIHECRATYTAPATNASALWHEIKRHRDTQ